MCGCGYEDEQSGEIPVAFIELEDDANIKESDVKKYLKLHLANYKVPKHIYFVEELPKNATGKVLKRVLRDKIHEYIKN